MMKAVQSGPKVASEGVLPRLLRPVPVFLATVALSGFAWSIPGESLFLRGFNLRVEASLGATLVLAGWYTTICALLWIGEQIGRSVQPLRAFERTDESSDLFGDRTLYVLTVIASVGTLAVLAEAGWVAGYLSALIATDANSLKEATGGGVGVGTLRYAAIIAAPLALHRLLIRKRGVMLAIWNLILLLIVGSIASRLGILMATVVFAILLSRVPTGIRPRPITVVLSSAALFAVLTLLNYTRNARSYFEGGITDPIAMNAFQMLAYLGAPFQVSLGVADAAFNANTRLATEMRPGYELLIPSFLQDEGSGDALWRGYQGMADVASGLTTNSAFADILLRFGLTGLLLSGLLMCLAGAIFGHFVQYRSPLVAISGVALYCIAEYWRAFLINQGITIFAMVIVGVSASIAGLVTPRVRGVPHGGVTAGGRPRPLTWR